MVERLILVALFTVALAVAIAAVRTWTAHRTRLLKVQARLPAWEALGDKPDGRATLIAFSSPSCAACHAAQAPAVDIAEKRHGANQVRVINVDVAGQPHIARAFGVLTVPSTVLIGADGRQIVAINHGFASSTRLLEQLQLA